MNDFFSGDGDAVLELHPRWAHAEPYVLAMAAAWGNQMRAEGRTIRVVNLGRQARYAARMRLFEHLGVDFQPAMVEHEEAGRFVPLTHVTDREAVRGVIGDISALLHLSEDPDTLAAVQYCVSELIRNVLEHAGARGGAFVCAHNYRTATVKRVAIAVADCGRGIRAHLAGAHAEAEASDIAAITLALRPGVTGARPGVYGTPDNAGAGLFITRSIAKGTGGYFLILSGYGAYRLRRAHTPEQQSILSADPTVERHDLWELPASWRGTVVSLEVRTDRIADFEGYFAWIRNHIPSKSSVRAKIRFG